MLPLAMDFPTRQRLNHLSTIAIDQKNYALAEKLLRQGLSTAPQDKWFLCKLGNVLIEVNRYDEAEQLARAAIEGDAEFAYGYATLTRALHFNHDYEASLAPAYQLIRLRPTSAHSYLTAAASLNELERDAECVEMCRQGLKCDSVHTPSMHFYSQSLARLNRGAEAIEMVKRFIQLRPDDFRGQAAAGWVYFLLNVADDDAERHFQASLQINPMSHWAHEGYGLLLMRRGSSQARIHLEEALRLNPRLKRARAALQELDAQSTKTSG